MAEDATYVYYVPAAPDDGSGDTVPFRVKDTRGGTRHEAHQHRSGPAYGLVEIRHDGGGEVTLSFYGVSDCKYYIQRKCGDGGTFSDLTGPITTPADGLIRYTNTPGQGAIRHSTGRGPSSQHTSQSGAKKAENEPQRRGSGRARRLALSGDRTTASGPGGASVAPPASVHYRLEQPQTFLRIPSLKA